MKSMFFRITLTFVIFALLAIAGLCLSISKSYAANFDISDVQVTIQAEDAVKARDQAILKAQRIAFGSLVGRNEEQISKITDPQISRLVSGFSVKNERLASRSYTANFTIRFEPNRTQSFIMANNFDLVSQELQSMTSEELPTQALVPENDTIVVLPVLDIGSRRVVWDDPNPWRNVWQEKDYSISGMPVRVPIGDISDIADIPDARFLSGGNANITNFLTRYSANLLYVAVAKNQGAALDPAGGMALSLYKHDGKRLQFVKKIVLHPRPGYMFNDAVPAALNMIVMAENNASPDDDDIAENDLELPAEEPTSLSQDLDKNAPTSEQTAILGSQTASGPVQLHVTVLYQNLPQWVSIQRRIRAVPGVRNLIPVRVSPSSAEIQIVTAETTSKLSENMQAAGFELQALPDGDIALVEK